MIGKGSVIKLSRKELCPNCKKSVVGLYQNIRSINPKKQFIRRAFYCKNCDCILNDNEIVYKKIIYKKLGVE